jgi:hypothetical protein
LLRLHSLTAIHAVEEPGTLVMLPSATAKNVGLWIAELTKGRTCAASQAQANRLRAFLVPREKKAPVCEGQRIAWAGISNRQQPFLGLHVRLWFSRLISRFAWSEVPCLCNVATGNLLACFINEALYSPESIPSSAQPPTPSATPMACSSGLSLETCLSVFALADETMRKNVV